MKDRDKGGKTAKPGEKALGKKIFLSMPDKMSPPLFSPSGTGQESVRKESRIQ